MAEDPRAPQHPSDIPSSRNTGGSGASVPPPPPQYTSPPPPPSSGNNQTRNIIIGAIATIIASTTVYYLTQYVNLRKSDSSSSASSFPVVKEATMAGWKTYVTVDNIYYKNIVSLGKNQELVKDLDKYEGEVGKETNKFLKDAETILTDKAIDNSFVSMVRRRIKREKEVRLKSSEFYLKMKSIANSTISKEEKVKKLMDEVVNPYKQYTQMIFEMTATEIEDLSKTMSEKFATDFDPMQFLLFADFKKGRFSFENSAHQHNTDSLTPAKNIDPKKLVGSWVDEGNSMELKKDGTMSYSRSNGNTGMGVWKIDEDFLRIDAVDNVSKLKTIYFFSIFDLEADHFTMKYTSTPYDVFSFSRKKPG